MKRKRSADNGDDSNGPHEPITPLRLEPLAPIDGLAERGDLSVRVLVEASANCPFETFLGGLRDQGAKARILLRLLRLERSGNFGDHRERIAGAVSELRVDYGPGYRIYYVRLGEAIVVLLCGGVKNGQQADIARAVELWERNQSDAERFSREFHG